MAGLRCAAIVCGGVRDASAAGDGLPPPVRRDGRESRQPCRRLVVRPVEPTAPRTGPAVTRDAARRAARAASYPAPAEAARGHLESGRGVAALVGARTPSRALNEVDARCRAAARRQCVANASETSDCRRSRSLPIVADMPLPATSGGATAAPTSSGSRYQRREGTDEVMTRVRSESAARRRAGRWHRALRWHRRRRLQARASAAAEGA